MKKLLSNFILAPLAIALAAGSLSAAPIKMSGSDLIGEKIEKELKADASDIGLELDISMAGSRDGLDLLKKDQTDIAIVAIPRGQPMPEGFTLVPYAHQIAAIVVNSENPLEEVSLLQLRQIFSSQGEKVDSWEKFGLNTANIVRNIYPLTVPLSENLALELFKNTCLDNANISDNVDVRKSSADVLNILKSTTNAIGIVGIIPPEGVKALAVSDSLDGAKRQAFKPTLENIQNGDYPIVLHFYIAYKKDKLKQLKPLLQILLSDRLAKVIDDGGLTAAPKSFRKSYSLELDIQK